MNEYMIDITAYDHVSTIKILARNADEAIAKAMAEKNISVTIKSVKGDTPTRTYDPDLDNVFVGQDGTIRWDGDEIGFVEKSESEIGKWRAEIGDVQKPEQWPGYRAAHARTKREAVADVLEGVEAP